MQKKYPYKNSEYTITELMAMRDCQVPGYVLRRNLWRKKLPVELALITQIKVMRKKAKRTYYYMGINMTVSELSELQECEVSYYQLLERLRKGGTIPEALCKGYEMISKSRQTISKFRLEPKSVQLDPIPKGSIISFSESVKNYDYKYSYEYLCLVRMGYVMKGDGIDIENTMNKRLL